MNKKKKKGSLNCCLIRYGYSVYIRPLASKNEYFSSFVRCFAHPFGRLEQKQKQKKNKYLLYTLSDEKFVLLFQDDDDDDDDE